MCCHMGLGGSYTERDVVGTHAAGPGLSELSSLLGNLDFLSAMLKAGAQTSSF